MNLHHIAEKYNGHLIGGCVVATVDGRKHYLTHRDEKGAPVKTEVLIKLEAAQPVAEKAPEPVKAEAPKKRQRGITALVEALEE